MITSNLKIRGTGIKYAISIMAKDSHHEDWEEVYVGIVDEGYATWYYPVNDITKAIGYTSIEEAKNDWMDEIETQLTKENRGWLFDLSTVAIREIKVSERRSW